MKSHPLLPHYFRQIESLRAAESAFIRFIAWLHRRMPGGGLAAALADIENCCAGRLDFLQSLVHRHQTPGPIPPCARTDPFLKTSMLDLARTEDRALRRAMAISICVELDRQLINDYRIARELAGRLRFSADVRRLDSLMSVLADRNLCWTPARSFREDTLNHLELVAG